MKDRLISVAASLVFSVPTAAVVWLIVNIHLAYVGDFLGSGYLWTTIAIFAIAAFVAPDTFPEILEKVWHWLAKIGFFWWSRPSAMGGRIAGDRGMVEIATRATAHEQFE